MKVLDKRFIGFGLVLIFVPEDLNENFEEFSPLFVAVNFPGKYAPDCMCD